MDDNATPHRETLQDNEAFSGRLFLWCLILGVLAGLGAIAFYGLLEIVSHVLLGEISGFNPERPAHEPHLLTAPSTPFRPWAIILIPCIGGLVAGWIAYRFAPESAGHGTDASIEAYHFHGGRVRARVPLVKAITSAFTIGSGGSGGAEGPITQIGAGIGSMLAERFGLSLGMRRRLMAAGMAGGIAAIFRAPLAGAVFASEVLYQDMDVEHEILVPAFITSVTAYSVFALAFGWEPLFAMPNFVFDNPVRLLIYFLLALVEGGIAILFVRLFYGIHDGFAKFKIPQYLKPAIGGLCVGLIGCVLPASLGTGYGMIQRAFLEDIGWSFLLIFVAAKIVTTCLSIGSGGSGGLFGPSLVIGCVIGRLVGQVGAYLLPAWEIHPGAFALVGMVGFLAAAGNCPIAALLFAGEITGNYRLIVPSMLVCMTSYAITRGHTLYRAQLRSRFHAPANMKSMMTEVLKSISVEWTIKSLGIPPPTLVLEKDNLRKMMDLYAGSDETIFPVVDDVGQLKGVVEARDVRRLLSEAGSIDGFIVHDIAVAPVTVRTSDTLYDVINAIQRHDRAGVIVVNDASAPCALGIIDPSSVSAAYDKMLSKREA